MSFYLQVFLFHTCLFHVSASLCLREEVKDSLYSFCSGDYNRLGDSKEHPWKIQLRNYNELYVQNRQYLYSWAINIYVWSMRAEHRPWTLMCSRPWTLCSMCWCPMLTLWCWSKHCTGVQWCLKFTVRIFNFYNHLGIRGKNENRKVSILNAIFMSNFST